MVPEAPGRFTMTMLLPRCGAAASAMARMWLSPAPPGGYGTISCSALLGKLSAGWAWAGANARLQGAAVALASALLLFIDMGRTLVGGGTKAEAQAATAGAGRGAVAGMPRRNG